MGVFAIPFTLNVELVGLKYKTIVGLLFQVPFAIGEILIGLCAMYVRDYRWFQTALAIPHAVMLLLYFVIPESPRWLIQKKKYKEARKIIERAAKFNKVDYSNVFSSYLIVKNTITKNLLLLIYSFYYNAGKDISPFIGSFRG